MNANRKAIFSNIKYENLRNLVIAAVVFIYFLNFIAFFRNGALGDDYMGYWSVGKIADEKGYSEIYDPYILRNLQAQELKDQGFLEKTDAPSFSPTLVPYLPFFILPFQLLSRVELVFSFWIWIALNQVILIGYLVFFLRRTVQESGAADNGLNLLILVLISYPVLKNFFSGQVNVFLLVCAGEFIRHAVGKKPVLSGLWLGGLLLKPQLLIIIVPIFLIMGNWKVLTGFIVSSGIILISSLILSGFAGMLALINLWTKFSDSVASAAPGTMINWRMVGLNLDNLLNTSLGWVITGLGMLLTLLAVYFLFKQRPPFGSPQWIAAMLGVFSATLAVTWNSHYYMAMVLIPFLIYVSVNRMLSEKIILLWGIVTPVALFGMLIIDLLVLYFAKIDFPSYSWLVAASTGFILNLVIFISAIRITNNRNLKQYMIPEK
jgi:hypothetical protein